MNDMTDISSKKAAIRAIPRHRAAPRASRGPVPLTTDASAGVGPYDRLLADLSSELVALRRKGLDRRLITVEAIGGPVVRVEGKTVVSWCSNDYLGLSSHPALAEAAARAAAAFGIGARASRLLAGTTSWHARLEESLAAWFGAEAALVYSSGYLTSLGSLAALLSSQDAVYLDRCAHASLFDAARASRATVRIFQHDDVADLTRVLSRATARRRVVITEGVFSMDGDVPPLAELVEVAETHGALVYLDDAHGAFVLGATGRGAPEAAGIPHRRLLYMATLGKALGCQGGCVVGPRVLIDLLRHRARTFIYTTAPSVPVTAAAVAALEVLRSEPQRREVLWERVHRLRRGLGSVGIEPGASASPIIPILIGGTRQATDLSRRLWERGLWAPAIRPPTVPEGAARLRLSVTARHTEAQIDQLVEALRDALIRGAARPAYRPHGRVRYAQGSTVR